MITRAPLRYATIFMIMLLGGLFFGNMILIYSALLVVVYLYLGFTIRHPSVVSISRLHRDAQLEVDDQFTFKYHVKVQDGIGLITIGCDVPKHFKLVEGNNFATLWKNPRPLETDICFTVQCEKRGNHRAMGAQWETRHPIELMGTNQGRIDDPTVITVYPKHYHIRRIRDRKIYSKMPIPTEAMIQTGVPTTSFKEIREYQIGDPFKSINWKATARRAHHQNQPPMVNEYEKEGRKTVWIFMNTASRMQIGTSVRNCFEYAIQSVLELSDFYINRNCLLGLALFNDDYPPGSIGFLSKKGRVLQGLTEESVDEVRDTSMYKEVRSILPPDSGTQQFIRLKNLTMQITPSVLLPSISEVLEQARSYVQGSSPLFIIITIVDETHQQELLDGILEMNRLSARRVGRSPILIVHLIGYELVGAPLQASRLRFLEDRTKLNRLMDSAAIIQWNPERGLLSDAIISQRNR